MISLIGNISLSHEIVLGIDACKKLGEEWVSISSLGLLIESDA
jgi:hypothetical protein